MEFLTKEEINNITEVRGLEFGVYIIDDQNNIIGNIDVEGYEKSSLWVKFRCLISKKYKGEKFPLIPIPVKNK